jgi:hypothetical protein
MATIDVDKLIDALTKAAENADPIHAMMEQVRNLTPEYQNGAFPCVSQSEMESGRIVSRVLYGIASALREASAEG